MAKEFSVLSRALVFVSTLRSLFSRLRSQRSRRSESRRNPTIILRKTCALSAVVSTALFSAHAPAAEETSAATSRQEKTFVLFRPEAAPTVVSPKAAAEMLRTPQWYEVVHTRWVQMNDFDATTAIPGDRVIMEVSPGDSYELVLTHVKAGYQGILEWRGTLPDRPEVSFYANFSADGRQLFRVSMAFGGSKHLVMANPAQDMQGWLALQDLIQTVPALGPQADPGALGDDIAKPLPPKPRKTPIQPGTEEG